MSNYVSTLEEVGSGSVALVGGKGENLGELVRAGFPVPQAFCVNTKAYESFIERNTLLPPILRELENLDYDNPAAIGHHASRIREMITSADTPEDIVDAIRTAYSQLESRLGAEVLVSVRSSATAEDLPGMSFAGQQDTYLNIHGADALLHYVKRCWASLWTDRAVSYRYRQGFRHDDVMLAVVIQEMFPSEVAGVMFTANPVTSNTGEVFINSSWGLGEAIVSGRVNPDQYIVEKGSLAIKEKRIHAKLIMTVRNMDGEGSAEVEVPEDKRSEAALSDEKIRELCEIGVGIEEHYGFPQDIEWGYSQGRFAILQAREITAADIDFRDGIESWQKPKVQEQLYDERWLWSRAYSDELQTGSSSPLFYNMCQAWMYELKVKTLRYLGVEEFCGFTPETFADMPLYRWNGARAYYNTAFEKERIRQFIPPFARDDAALWIFPEDDREQIRNMPFNWPRFLWLMLRLHVTNPKISLIETTQHMYEGVERWKAHEEEVWSQVDLENASVKEIFKAEVRSFEGSGFMENVVLPFSIYLYVLPAALKALCEWWCDDEDGTIYNHLVAGLRTKTSEENIAVWKLTKQIRESSALMEIVQTRDAKEFLPSLEESEEGRKLKLALDEFLKNYGHRGGAERDPIHHRWKHKPDMVFHSIRPLLSLSEDEDPELMEERLYRRMLETKEQCLEKIGKQELGFLKAPFFKWFVNLTQDYIYYRDFERFWNDKTMSRPRDIYTAIARRFIKQGLMKEEEDIFFLIKKEILAADEGRFSGRDIDIRVRARRRVYERYTNNEPPKYIRGWETFDDDLVLDDGKGFRGIAASTGVVTGRACVCRKLAEISKVEKGDILITVATDPGWTTVFSLLGGVVVEAGGVVAHAAMISREYGIPCVTNLTNACNLIPDGKMITVDGTSGRVLLHEKAE
ncbi:PEP/pyruvate-binding domain-containing protein [Thermodesulfobacteriota bacterium]